MSKPRIDALVSVEQLREILSYDPATGLLRWLPRQDTMGRPNTRLVGTVAGTLGKGGQIQVRIALPQFEGFVQAHRVAWALHHGYWPVELIDHRDTVRNHNWISNLREASSSNNNCNRTCVGKTSGFKGVYWNEAKDRFGAQIKINKKSEWLGLFETAEEAAQAYDKRAIELHGKFARTNKLMGLL